ncbi:hypothetical protein KL906_001372 [Ogataea polymorpha]|nr:hypothetical protein KL906_001372 [Ogataea polymorpha]
MGIFSSSSSAPEAPSRTKRENCWESRDIYFKCLDEIKVVNPFDKDVQDTVKKNCGAQDVQFQKDCVQSWVRHFKEKRVFEAKKERMIREAEEHNAQLIQLGGK